MPLHSPVFLWSFSNLSNILGSDDAFTISVIRNSLISFVIFVVRLWRYHAKLAVASTPTEDIKIDYRTGITLIDVVPENRYWSIKPNYVKPLVCTDIIYRDSDGIIDRLGIHKNTWPEDLTDMYSQITREIRQQERETTAPRGRLRRR